MWIICKRGFEYVNHLLWNVFFLTQFWTEVLVDLQLIGDWTQSYDESSFEYNLQNWIHRAPQHKDLPSFSCWGIWKARNLGIYEDVHQQAHVTCFKIPTLYRIFSKNHVMQKQKTLKKPFFLKNETIGLFDGTASSGLCGGSIMIRFHVRKYCMLWIGCGPGTNIQVELLALWGLLHFASIKGSFIPLGIR